MKTKVTLLFILVSLFSVSLFGQSNDTCSCSTLTYLKTHYDSSLLLNKVLKDSVDLWRKWYINSNTSQEYSYINGKYKKTKNDSVWHKGKYVQRKQYESQNFETKFMPGAGYAYYKPKAADSLGSFGGIAIEYLIYGKVEENDNPGPSHVRFYGKLNLQNSSKSDMGQLFWYGAGLDLSIEKNPKRTFLIPYFGLETGGISNKTLGTVAHFTPIIGLHILSKENLFINVHAGQVYTTKNIEMLQGYFLQGTVNFSLWR